MGRVEHRKRGTDPQRRAGAPGFFATTLPGLGRLLRQEITAHPDLEPLDELGNDGRADIVFFRMHRGAKPDLATLRLAEDVFVTLARTTSGPPRRVADSLVTRTDLERGLSVWTRFARHLNSSMTYRVIARVVDEGRFKRTELRDAITIAVAGQRPRWRVEDPAELELWALEYQRAAFVAGLRLSDKRMRQHGDGRTTERRGALRPVVAAAMIRLAGESPGRMLDPCCGSGTFLEEALSVGWEAVGSDLDPEAVATARENVPRAVVEQADVQKLPHDDAAFNAVVSNLPFGRQFQVADPARWLRRALTEMARVTRPGGHVVVLVPPPVPRSLSGLNLASSYPLRLLGVSTRIWAFDRDQVQQGAPAPHHQDAAPAHS
ncbi:MAG: TRM11 family SAM-dependent methyltransferase [Pseudonocardiaceae bacterium]